MTLVDIGGGHTVALEKMVAFRLFDPNPAERFLTVFLQGGHKVKTSDREGIARFIGAVGLEDAQHNQET